MNISLFRESINGEGMKTLDELFSHCEQLVETLSQVNYLIPLGL